MKWLTSLLSRHHVWALGPLLAALFIFGTAATLPPMPPTTSTTTVLHSPKYKALLSSLGTPMKKAVASTTLAPTGQPQMFYHLAWYYPSNLVSSVVFEIWHATYLSSFPALTSYDQIPAGFTLLTEVTGGTNCLIQTYQAAEFFIIRARDIATGTHSGWNVTAAMTGPLERVVMVSPINGQVVSNTITLEARVITLDPPSVLSLQ